MTIPSSRSLIFEVKSTGSELAFIRVLRLGDDNFALGRLRTSSNFFGRLRTSSGTFGNDRVVFKNPSTPRIKISRLYLRKSWQVYSLCQHLCQTWLRTHKQTWRACETLLHCTFSHFDMRYSFFWEWAR